MSDPIALLEQIIRERSALIGKLQREVDGLELAVRILRTPDTDSAVKAPESAAAAVKPGLAVPRAKKDPLQSGTEHQNAVMTHLLRAGCDKGWVKVTHAELVSKSGLSMPSVSNATQALNAKGMVRVKKLTKGPERGNWFTTTDLPFETPGIPEAAPSARLDVLARKMRDAANSSEPSAAAPADLDPRTRLLAHLWEVSDRIGLKSFELPVERLRDKMGCTHSGLRVACIQLYSAGKITFVVGAGGDSFVFNLIGERP